MSLYRTMAGWVLLISPLAVCAAEPPPAHVTEPLRGKVRWTAEALKERFGIVSDPDSAQSSVSLVTADGKVHPMVHDERGRAFLKDDRLRNREMELLVRRHNGSPFLQ